MNGGWEGGSEGGSEGKKQNNKKMTREAADASEKQAGERKATGGVSLFDTRRAQRAHEPTESGREQPSAILDTTQSSPPIPYQLPLKIPYIIYTCS